MLAQERLAHAEQPQDELVELDGTYQHEGLSAATAALVAAEFAQHDAFAAHLDVEFGLDADSLTNPGTPRSRPPSRQRLGRCCPSPPSLSPPAGLRIPATVVTVLIALALAVLRRRRRSDAGAHDPWGAVG